VLQDKDNSLSRWHCGILSNQNSVWLDDYESLNGTEVNGAEISASRKLNSADVICIGPYKIKFRAIHENTILAQ
jgi:pSer/pThr/pTyr-binding forkhead associated (FHA) protein